MWDALSDERTDLSFTVGAGPRQRSHPRVHVPQDSLIIFYCIRLETPPTWRARSSSPRKRVTQLYPQAQVFLFVVSYYLQGYGGGIRTRLRTV
jgi:hypothetical protein